MFAPRFPVLAKVRAGRKNDKGHPESVEWLECEDDPRFAQWAGKAQANPLRIILPYDLPGDVFTTSRERWDRSTQSCYSNDGVVAHRLAAADGWTLDFKARARTAIACRGEQCPDSLVAEGDKQPRCKPTGRLYFFVEGQDDLNGVFAFETHGMQTIQRISAVLSVWGQGGLLGKGAELTVAMTRSTKGVYPVVTLAIDGAPAAAEAASQTAMADEKKEQRARLIAGLRNLQTDPKAEAVVAWVQRVGIERALEVVEQRLAAER